MLDTLTISDLISHCVLDVRMNMDQGSNFFGSYVKVFSENRETLDRVQEKSLSNVHNVLFTGGNDSSDFG